MIIDKCRVVTGTVAKGDAFLSELARHWTNRPPSQLAKYDGKLQVARSCGCSHTTVLDIQKRATASGLKWPLPENIDETTLERMLYPKLSRQLDNKPEPDFNYIHRELRKHKSFTLMLLWQGIQGTARKWPHVQSILRSLP